jgi:hypothetical protein
MRKIYFLLVFAVTTNVQAQTNFALTFNGTTNLVNIGVPLPQGSAYTKEAWVSAKHNFFAGRTFLGRQWCIEGWSIVHI